MFTPRYIKHGKLLLQHALFVMSSGVETSLIVNRTAARDLTRSRPLARPRGLPVDVAVPQTAPFSTSLRFARYDRLLRDSSFVIRHSSF
jgi:hypothetical protein